MSTIVPPASSKQADVAYTTCPNCGDAAKATSTRHVAGVTITDCRCAHAHIWSIHWLKTRASITMEHLVQSLTAKALGACVVYDGLMPKRPRDYYALTEDSPYRAYVYVLWNANRVPVYIGQSWRPGNRFDRHRRRDWWSEVTDLTIVAVTGDDRWETERAMKEMEALAIRQLDPLYNIAGMAR